MRDRGMFGRIYNAIQDCFGYGVLVGIHARMPLLGGTIGRLALEQSL